jgi:hypothetical protein
MKNALALLIAFPFCLSVLAAEKAQKPGTALDGYRFEFPCKGEMPDKPKKGAGCQSALVKGDPFKTDNFKKVISFGGKAGTRYAVTLHVRGVVEPMMYKNGKMDGEHFYVGGEPNNATYNIYKIDVASPKGHFFLNRQDRVGHRIFTIDYVKTIEIEGGSKITLSGDGQNGKLISNFSKLVVPDLKSVVQPYHGQFIQLDVVKVEAVN